MKKNRWLVRGISAVIFMMTFAACASAPKTPASIASPESGFETVAENGAVTITKYTGRAEEVVIPARIGGLPVTAIGKNAFYNCTSLTAVTIPSSVTLIGGGAFAWCDSLKDLTIPPSVTLIGNDAFTHCTSLTAVTIPSSVTAIGDNAFAMCDSLADLTIPPSVTTIGSGAFSYCPSLTAFTVDKRNNKYASMDGVIFDKNIQTIIAYPAGKRGAYTIPSSVTQIRKTAFSGCHSLSNVTIPSSVTAIGDYAFHGCHSLTDLTIPSSVTTIGKSAFSYCSGLNPAVRAEIQGRFGDAPLN